LGTKLTANRFADTEDEMVAEVERPAVKTSVRKDTPIRQTVRRAPGLRFEQRLLRRYAEVREVGPAGLKVLLVHTLTLVYFFVMISARKGAFCFIYIGRR
jgi:hypothetical protein